MFSFSSLVACCGGGSTPTCPPHAGPSKAAPSGPMSLEGGVATYHKLDLPRINGTSTSNITRNTATP